MQIVKKIVNSSFTFSIHHREIITYMRCIQVMERLGSIDKRYKELLELNKTRKQRLLDALSLYKLFNEADAVDAWINEKEKFLHTIVPSKDDMEELEVMRHRLVGLPRSGCLT